MQTEFSTAPFALFEPPGVCVSLFMPTEQVGPAAQQHAIRFENMLRDAEAQLAACGVSPDTAQALLAPALPLIGDRVFWAHHSTSLALFAAPEMFQTYHLPYAVEPLVVVGEQFHVLPLLSLLDDTAHFYVLELSLEQVQLLRCTHYSVEPVRLHSIPSSLQDALKYDEFGKQAQFHSGIPGRGGERGPIFHGHGSRDDAIKEEIVRYFQQVDRGVRATLKDHNAPLVLAGLSYLLPLYREASASAALADQGVAGNPGVMSLADLHTQAWSIVEPQIRRTQHDAAARYQPLKARQPALASNYLRAILPAAHEGRIAVLFVALDQHVWGRFEPDTGAITLHDAYQPGDADLLNVAALATLRQGGAVYPMESEAMPEDGSLAALFRY